MVLFRNMIYVDLLTIHKDVSISFAVMGFFPLMLGCVDNKVKKNALPASPPNGRIRDRPLDTAVTELNGLTIRYTEWNPPP